MIPFGAWLPDVARFESGAATDAKNVVPHQSGYQPFNAFVAAADAITARCQGAISVRAPADGVISSFCGDATKLYKMDTDGLGWADVSRSVGGAYATPATGNWSFAQFGPFIFATNLVDDVQSYELGTSTLFAAAAGTPPKAAYVGVIRGFVVLAKLDGAYNKMAWSALEDPEDFVPSATTLSDTQEFPEGGEITGFVGGEFGLVFQENAIHRMTFAGPPTVFNFDKLANNIGCAVPGTIASHENMAFFKAQEGFHMVRGGAEIVPIGEEKIDEWFEDNVNGDYLERVSAVVDPVRHLYMVSFPSGDSADGTPDTILSYNWRLGRWSYVEATTELLYSGIVQTGYTIDTMDSVSATIDGLTYPLDSRFWTGSGGRLLAGFNSSHQQGFFTGTKLEATIETGDEQPNKGGLALMRQVRPMVEGTSVTPSVSIGYRKRLQDTVAYTNPVSANATGICPVRANGRYIRAKVTIPAGDEWTFARGIDDLRISPMGRR